MNKTPEQRTAAGFAAAVPTRRSRDGRLAAAFREDPAMERWLTLKRTDPARFGKLPLSTRIAAGYYMTAKDAAERERQEEDDRG